MKTILIEQVSNGWIVRCQEESPIKFSNGTLHVYRSLKELQQDLPNLFALEPSCPTPDEIEASRKQAVQRGPVTGI